MAVTVITCSGIPNTGKLTAQTGTALMRRCGGRIEACIAATRPTASLGAFVRHADRLLVLGGGGGCCGGKKVQGGTGEDTAEIQTPFKIVIPPFL